jgi:hypothetical protein
MTTSRRGEASGVQYALHNSGVLLYPGPISPCPQHVYNTFNHWEPSANKREIEEKLIPFAPA